MRQSDEVYMNRESFLDTIKQQYTDEIREAYLECEHGYAPFRVDVMELNRRLNKLRAIAKKEGLPMMDFEELARAALPDVAEMIEFEPVRKAA